MNEIKIYALVISEYITDTDSTWYNDYSDDIIKFKANINLFDDKHK